MTSETEPQGAAPQSEPDTSTPPQAGATEETAQPAVAATPTEGTEPDGEASAPEAATNEDATSESRDESDAIDEAAPTDASEPTDTNPFALGEEQPSAAEREYRAALEAARALGLDTAPAVAAVDLEEQEAARLVSELGLDQPTPAPTETLPTLDEPESAEAEEVIDEEEDFLGPEPTDGRAWYVLNTYSGHENRVKENLERRIGSMDVADRIHRVVVPTEEELEIRGGQRRQVQRKLLPGYVLVEMVLDNATWYVVRNTPGVTGFVGSDEPSPLPREEVKSILRQMRVVEPRVRVGFELGDTVRVTDGPFMDFMAQVDEINLEKGKVRALISMFGRETPVELDFIQVEKV